MKPHILINLLILAGLATGSQAAMYKWVDANGVTVYSQTPPASGPSTRVKPPPPPAMTPEEARERLDRSRQNLEDAAEDRELASQKDSQKDDQADTFKANCSAARNNLMNWEGNPRKLVGQSDGTYARVTEEERQQKMQEGRHMIEKFCK